MTELEILAAQAAYNDCVAEANDKTTDAGAFTSVGVCLLATAALFW